MRSVMLSCLGLFGLLTLGLSLSSSKDDPVLVAPTEARTPEEERKGFHLPAGFEIQLVASEPDIHKPMNLAFDDRGRLWVTESVEYPYPAPADKKGRDAVKILEDTNGDGKADKVTTFADGLNIPIGLMPIKNGALVYSIPNLFRMLDTDGDDKADTRELLIGSFGFRDTHGMCSSFTWGLDGWLYATHGFSNTSELKAKDGSTITMNSGNTFRIKPDGSHIEQWTWGQVNPFGMCFDPLGNLYTADCHSRPIMMLLRGGHYQSFGKPHDGLGFAPEMCLHDHGSTGIAGIVYYAADHFPKEYQDTIFIGNPVTNRINHDHIERRGSTVIAVQQPDFLTCDDPWFRPVNIQLGPDGALYVADFYNCIIGHYEVPLTHPRRDRERGRIWRIVYKGTDGKGQVKSPIADFGKATVNELIENLGHPNITVRTKATNQLVERGTDAAAIGEAIRTKGPLHRQHGLWVMERLNALPIERLVAAFSDSDPAVRIVACRIAAERKELPTDVAALLMVGLKDQDATVQRAAADALGRRPMPSCIRPLLGAWERTSKDDTQLVHTIRMALRDQLRPNESWTVLKKEVLDEQDVRRLADVSLGVPTTQAAEFLLTHLGTRALGDNNRASFVHHIARHGTPEAVTALLAVVQHDQPNNLGHQLALLKAVQEGTQERGGQLGPDGRAWAEEVTRGLLASNDGKLLQAGLEQAIALKLPSAKPRLTELAHLKGSDENRRFTAFAALCAIDAKSQIPPLGQVLADASEPITLREKIANTLAGTNLPEARAELVKNLPTAPARLQTTLAAALAGSKDGAESLLQAISEGKASARLLQEQLVETRLRATRLPMLNERLAALTKGLPPADAKLLELVQKRRSGFVAAKPDATLGAKVFDKHCAACHQLANKGAKVGPQLDGIGIRGLDRLLEDLIDPNRNVDQAFRSSILSMTDGQIVQGLILREEGEVVILADAQGKEVRYSKSDIADKKASSLSPMPANLIEQVAEKDFYDLMAFLLGQRAK